MRITQKMLEGKVDRLNFILRKSGYLPADEHIYLSKYNPGDNLGFQVFRSKIDKVEENKVFPGIQGDYHIKAKRLYDFLEGVEAGLDLSKNKYYPVKIK